VIALLAFEFDATAVRHTRQMEVGDVAVTQARGRPVSAASIVGPPIDWASTLALAVDEEAARRDELRRKRRQAVISCCKRFVAFLFSHVGLAAMVVAYSILGGFLFRAIEAPNERDVKVSVQSSIVILNVYKRLKV